MVSQGRQHLEQDPKVIVQKDAWSMSISCALLSIATYMVTIYAENCNGKIMLQLLKTSIWICFTGENRSFLLILLAVQNCHQCI